MAGDSFQNPGAQASNEQLVRQLEQLTARLNEGLAGAAKVADTAATNLKLEAKFVDMQVVSYKELNALIARRVQLEGQAAAAALRTAEATVGAAARGPAVAGSSGGGVLLPVGAGKSAAVTSEVAGAAKVREMSTAEADLAKNMRLTAAASIEANSGLTKGALSSEAITKFANGTITLKELGGQVQETISKFGGWTLAAGAVYGAFGAISTLKTGAVDASSAVRELSKYIQGLDTGRALQSITSLSQKYNLPIAEVGQTTAAFAQVYHNLPQSLSASEAALTAEKLGGMKPQDATEALTAIAKQSGGPSALSGIMDQFVSAQSRLGGGANLANMLPGVARVLGSTKLTGETNIGQLIGVMGLVSQLTGAGGLQIGQAMAKGSQNLLTPTSQNILRQSGINPLQGYVPALLEAMRKSPGMNPQERGLLGSVFFSGMRGASLTAALSASPQQLQGALGDTAAGAHPGIAQKQLGEESKKASEQLKELKTNLSAIGAELAGSGFTTPFGLVVTYLNDALKLTSQLMAMWNGMPGIIKDAGTAVAVAFGARAVATHFGLGSRGAARMEGVQQAAIQGAVNESLQAELVGSLSARAKAAQAAAKADLAYQEADASGDAALREEAAARLEAAKAASISAQREYELSAAMAEQYGTGGVARAPGRVAEAESKAAGGMEAAGMAAIAPGSRAAEGEAVAAEEASMTLRERASGLAMGFTSLLTPMNMFIGAMVAAPLVIDAFTSGLKASHEWTQHLTKTQQSFQQTSTAQQFVQGASQYAAAVKPPELSFWQKFSYTFTHPNPFHPLNANTAPEPSSEQYDQAQLAQALAPSVTTYQRHAEKLINTPAGRRKLQDLFNRLTGVAEGDDPNSPTNTLGAALVGKSTNPKYAVAPQYEAALQDAYKQAIRTHGGSVPGMFWNTFGSPQNISGFMDQLTAASQYGESTYSGQSTGVQNIIRGYATSVRKFGAKNPQIIAGEQQKVVGAVDEQVKLFQGIAESAPTLGDALRAYNDGLSHVSQAISAVRHSDMPQSAKKALIGRIRQEAQGMASGLVQTLQTQAELASSSIVGVGPQADLERAQILLRQDENALSKAKSTRGVSAEQVAQLQLKVNQDRNAVMQAQLTADEQMTQAMSQLEQAQTADPIEQMTIDINNLNSLLAKIQGQGIKDQYERLVLQARISSDLLQKIADEVSQEQAQTQAWLAQADIGQNSLTQAHNAVTAASTELNFILAQGKKVSPAQVAQAYQNYYQSLAAAFQAQLQEGQAMIQAQSEAAQGGTFDPVRIAQIALTYDRRLLAYMQANSAAYNPSAVLQQQAKVAQEYKSLREAQWQKDEAGIHYLAETYQITGAQEIARLQKVLKAMKAAHASYTDIQRVAKELYDLEYNNSGDWNLNVGKLHLPSTYEVRSAILGGRERTRRKTSAGLLADVKTNVNMSVIIERDVDMRKLTKALNEALGTSVQGLGQAAGLV